MALLHLHHVKLLTQTRNLEKPDRLVLVTGIKRSPFITKIWREFRVMLCTTGAGWLNNTSVEAVRKHVYTMWTDYLQNRNGIKDPIVPCPQSIPKHPCIFSLYLAPMNSGEWISMWVEVVQPPKSQKPSSSRLWLGQRHLLRVRPQTKCWGGIWKDFEVSA